MGLPFSGKGSSNSSLSSSGGGVAEFGVFGFDVLPPSPLVVDKEVGHVVTSPFSRDAPDPAA